MTLPADIEFHEDIHLFIYRPSGLMDQASVSRAVSVLADHEAKLKEPFNRFSDASAIDRVELNYQYVIQVSLYRVLTYADRSPVKSAMLATDSIVGHISSCMPSSLRTPRSTFESFNNEKTPRNGSVCRPNGSSK